MSKRVLIFSTAYAPFIGGAEIAVQEITKRISGIEFDLITTNLDGRQPVFEKIDSVRVYRVGKSVRSKFLFPVLALWKGLTLHRSKNYDVVWSIMASYAGFAGLFFSYFHPKIPLVLTLQEGDTHEELKRRFRFLWPFFIQIFKRAVVIQAISKYLADFAKNIDPETKIQIIPNGVDVSYFSRDVDTSALKKKFEKKETDILLVTTSRLVRKNAVADIIVSMKFLPENTKLVIVGDGEEKSALEKLARENHLSDRIFFEGEIPHKQIVPYLKVADVFVRPSLSEGFGNSFVEAMAAGLPVVATPVGGIIDFVFDPEISPNEKPTGLLCQPGNPEDLALKINTLIKTPELIQELAENASSLVREKYDWGNISLKIKAIFDSI